MQVGVASVTVKKKVTLTFIIKRRPSIRLSALIYTQLRRKKNTPPRDPERLSCSKYQKKTEPF